LRLFNHHIHKLGILLLGVEILILIASFYLGVAIRFYIPGQPYLPMLPSLLPQAIIFASVMILSMQAMGMYELASKDNLRSILLRLMPSFVMGFGLITLIVYIAPNAYFGRGVLLLVLLFSTVGILLTRKIFSHATELDFLQPRIMILGTGELAKECAQVAEHNENHHQFNLIGFVSVDGDVSVVNTPDILPANVSLCSLSLSHQPDEIIVAVQNQNSSHFPIQALLECKLKGIKVLDAASFFEREMSQIRVNSLNPNWLVFGGGFEQSGLNSAIKRIFDLFASTLLLLLTLPVMLITALCIYFQDRRPIFYRQERIGLEGIPFTVYKFRSMRHDAEICGKPQWASENDPRITPVGRIIRKLRIDELPQIFNVLKGEMSLIGPRPEREYFIKQLCEQIPYFNVRHSIKPGITGWAQVRYQYGSSVEDALQKLQYDLYYVKNNSLFLDIIILIDTVRVVLTGKGSR